MPETPDKVDLSALDPSAGPSWDRTIAAIAERGRDRRRFRRAVVRRGAVAVVLATAAAVVVWFAAPKHEVVAARGGDILDWATRDVDPSELLGLGGSDAR